MKPPRKIERCICFLMLFVWVDTVGREYYYDPRRNTLYRRTLSQRGITWAHVDNRLAIRCRVNTARMEFARTNYHNSRLVEGLFHVFGIADIASIITKYILAEPVATEDLLKFLPGFDTTGLVFGKAKTCKTQARCSRVHVLSEHPHDTHGFIENYAVHYCRAQRLFVAQVCDFSYVADDLGSRFGPLEQIYLLRRRGPSCRKYETPGVIITDMRFVGTHEVNSEGQDIEMYIDLTNKTLYERRFANFWSTLDVNGTYDIVKGEELETARNQMMLRQQGLDSLPTRIATGNTLSYVSDVMQVIEPYIAACFAPRLVPATAAEIASWLPNYDLTGIKTDGSASIMKFCHRRVNCEHIDYGVCVYYGAEKRVHKCSRTSELSFEGFSLWRGHRSTALMIDMYIGALEREC